MEDGKFIVIRSCNWHKNYLNLSQSCFCNNWLYQLAENDVFNDIEYIETDHLVIVCTKYK